jgi:AhpD family alkylhydroperoxidase
LDVRCVRTTFSSEPLTLRRGQGEMHMQTYPIHTLESAPEKSRPALEGLKKSFGLVPNLAATMSESPVLISSFVGVFANFHGGSFSGAQRQLLLLTNAVENSCAWAVAFHSTIALKEGADPEDVRAIRERRRPRDPASAALSGLSRALIEKRGHLEPRALEAFAAGGFAPAQVLEVIAGLAISVMANYAGNITKPALEEAFKAQAWGS